MRNLCVLPLQKIFRVKILKGLEMLVGFK